MPEPASPTVRRRRLAAELRRLREHASLTGEEVADQLGWSASKISRIENARTGPKLSDTRKLLELYGVTGSHQDELVTLARDATRRGWWEAYSDALSDEYSAFIGLETEAVSALQWEAYVVPGLFQTEAYARQTVKAIQPIVSIPPGQVEARIKARLGRQRALTRDQPLKLSVVVDESALLRKFGDASTMRIQLERLAEASELPNVTLQVLRLGGVHPIGVGSFSVLKFAQVYEVDLNDVIYVEQLTRSFYFEGEDEAYRHGLAFDRLTANALSPEESRSLIIRTAREVWS